MTIILPAWMLWMALGFILGISAVTFFAYCIGIMRALK